MTYQMEIRIQVNCQYEIIQYFHQITDTQNNAQILNHTPKTKCTNAKSHTQKPNVQLQNHYLKKLHTKY
jgi:hypothetical protein